MSLVFTPLATDNFTPNAGSLNPAHWTTFTDAATYGAARPHSGAFESTTTAFNNSLIAAAAYTGVPFPANQYVAFTLAAWSLGSNDESDWWLRMPDLTGDIGYVADAVDNGDGITAVLELGYYDISQQFISLWSNENAIVSQGDTFIFAIVGSTLYLYQNGVLVSGAVNDPLNYYPSTGPVGLDVDPQGSATEIGLSNFTAGSAALSSGAYSQPDCRVTKPNSATGETINGTILYDSQTSSNPAIPPTDSRVSKPVACGAYPQNSRTPGTYGPGE